MGIFFLWRRTCFECCYCISNKQKSLKRVLIRVFWKHGNKKRKIQKQLQQQHCHQPFNNHSPVNCKLHFNTNGFTCNSLEGAVANCAVLFYVFLLYASLFMQTLWFFIGNVRYAYTFSSRILHILQQVTGITTKYMIIQSMKTNFMTRFYATERRNAHRQGF